MLSVQRNQQLASRYLMAVNEAKEWIRAVTRLSMPASKKDFEASLADGIILCKLFNEIASALNLPQIQIVPVDKLSYKRIENINAFLDACRSFGLSSAELFEPIDLFEQKRFPKVIHCLRALSRTAAVKGFSKQIMQKFYDLRSRKVLFSDDDLGAAQEDLDMSSSLGTMFVEMLGLDFEARAESKEELPPPPPPRARDITPPRPPVRSESVTKSPSKPSITIDWSAAGSVLFVIVVCLLWVWLWTQNQRRLVTADLKP